MHPSSFSSDYKKGVAIGITNIKDDSLTFFYRGKNGMEEFSVPSRVLLKYPQKAKFNGIHYEAKIEDVRKAAKER